ncbi:unnamed protein product [Clonostachys chloroleuca]|uniref:Uncharacterized protein n=1 Tax=Clonostachys chloroleuca TaxID=1926264 RepID=A0AA35PZ23_9HYPO|nr:unnamed protein product [Clonostachys chloroleuca]
MGQWMSPMVLQMVCAVGGQKWCELNRSLTEARARRMKAIEHYGVGPRLLVAITQTTDDTTHLDCILVNLWLMVIYELKFGDGCGVGLNAHLQGVAPMIQGRLRPILSEFDLDEPLTSAVARSRRRTPFSCRVQDRLWIALLDGGAREALKQNMALTFKVFRDQSQKAMMRLVWPLFVAKLESDDMIHRTWILQRYDEPLNLGENYRRAREVLRVAFREQHLDERMTAYSDLSRRDDIGCFII